MSPAIQFSGLTSGLDTTSIIDALMAAERTRITRLEVRRSDIQNKQTALNDIKTRLVNLQLKAADLNLTSKINAKKATPTDATILAATAGTDAAAGTFNVNVKQLATTTVATSKTSIGNVISTGVALTAAGFATTPTAGAVTINGVSITIDVTRTLVQIVSDINAAGAGVTASLTTDSSGRADNALQLVSNTNGKGIQLGAGGDTSNLLTVLKVLGVAPTITTGGTLAVGGLTAGNGAVLTAIDTSAATQQQETYTFSYNAGTNVLTLTRASDSATDTVTVLDIGETDSDTYDFDALGIKATIRGVDAGGETADDIGAFFDTKTITTALTTKSQGNLGTALAAEALSSARLDATNDFGAALTASGSFKINGTTISWANTDSLNTVISRINASGANVSAAYSLTKDALVLTAKATGAALITVEDVTGNFMDVMELATAVAAPNATDTTAQVAGKNAVISIDGGADFSNAGNTVTGAVTGLSLELKKLGITAVTVTQDADPTVTAAKDFIAQFNSVLDLIRQKTKYDTVNKKAELLLGDSSVRTIQTRLVGIVTGTFDGAVTSDKFRSFGDLGITFGTVGSGVGTTNTLILDETKFRNALTADASAVEKVFKTFTNTATLVDGAGSITSISGGPTDHHKAGQYVITSSGGGGTLSSVFTPTGGAAQTAVIGTITAGGTTATVIPGVILSSSALSDGTDTINVTVNTLGVTHKVNDYLKETLGVTGLFKGRQDSTDSQVKSINDQISAYERRIAQRRATLERQFAEMERALATLKSQQSSLTTQLGQLQQR